MTIPSFVLQTLWASPPLILPILSLSLISGVFAWPQLSDLQANYCSSKPYTTVANLYSHTCLLFTFCVPSQLGVDFPLTGNFDT